jgi:hypothetical protein
MSSAQLLSVLMADNQTTDRVRRSFAAIQAGLDDLRRTSDEGTERCLRRLDRIMATSRRSRDQIIMTVLAACFMTAAAAVGLTWSMLS